MTLAAKDKLKTAEQIDKGIWAVIPDRKTFARLFDVIKRNNIHGPCDERCLTDGKCKKKFPKAFQEETNADVDGYPLYRRPDDGTEIEFAGFQCSIFRLFKPRFISYKEHPETLFSCSRSKG